MDRSVKRLQLIREARAREKVINGDLIRRVPAITTTDVVDSTVFISIQTNAAGETVGTLTVFGGPDPQITALPGPGNPPDQVAPPLNPASTAPGNELPNDGPKAGPGPVIVPPAPNVPQAAPPLPAPSPPLNSPPPLATQNPITPVIGVAPTQGPSIAPPAVISPPAQESNSRPPTTANTNSPLTLVTGTVGLSSSGASTSGTAPVDPTHVPGFIGGPGNRNSSPTSNANGTLSDAQQGNTKGPSAPVVAGAVVGSIGAIAVLLLIILMILRCHRSRQRTRNYNGGAGDSGANLAGTTPVSPDGGTSMVTQRRGIIPSGAFFTDRLSTAQREQFNSSPNRSSSPTLGNDGFLKHGARRAAVPFGAAAVGAAAVGAASMEAGRHGSFQQRDFTTSPIPEHPPQIDPPRASDAISVTSMYREDYREDWPGSAGANVEPLFHDEFPPRAHTTSPYVGRALSTEAAVHGMPERPASNISLWPGPGASQQNDGGSGGTAQNTGPPLTTHHEDELPETIRPSPARTPQIHSAEITSYPFPERQASPHTGFNTAAFPSRNPNLGPFSNR